MFLPASPHSQTHFSGLVLHLFADYFRSVFVYLHLATCEEYFRSGPILFGARRDGCGAFKSDYVFMTDGFRFMQESPDRPQRRASRWGIWTRVIRLFLLIKCKKYSTFIFIRDLWNKRGRWILQIIGFKRNNCIFCLTFLACYKLS